MQWILGLALAAAVFVILKQWGALSAEKKKAATWKIVLGIAAVGLALGVGNPETLAGLARLVWKHVVGSVECGFVVHTGGSRFGPIVVP